MTKKDLLLILDKIDKILLLILDKIDKMDQRLTRQEALVSVAVDRSRQTEAVAERRRLEHVDSMEKIQEQEVDAEMVSGLVRIFTANGLIRPFPPRYHPDDSPPPYYKP